MFSSLRNTSTSLVVALLLSRLNRDGSRDAIAIPKTERRCMRLKTFEVRIFVPTIYAIEARTEQEALAKVAALYKELYAKDVRTWIEPLPEPEDM